MARSTVWEWMQQIGGTCGFTQAAPAQPRAMWVRAAPELAEREVPGVGLELRAIIDAPGGSLEDKLQAVVDSFRSATRHLESLQVLLRNRAIDKREERGEPAWPEEVQKVISTGQYPESFLQAFDGQSFLLHRDEVVPYHEYRLALEVHSGGAYWSSIPVQDSGSVMHSVETVSASGGAEGSATVISQFGAAQRGAVFVWRWKHEPYVGPHALPDWLAKSLSAEGNDPVRKLIGELEAVRRWQEQVKSETAKHIKRATEIKDLYVREVLRLWPCETDSAGFEQVKKCAWVEGLDPQLFVGKPVTVRYLHYDAGHSLALHATINKRHQEDPTKENNPPYRLTTTWHWATAPQGGPSSSKSVQATPRSSGRPGTSQSKDPPPNTESIISAELSPARPVQARARSAVPDSPAQLRSSNPLAPPFQGMAPSAHPAPVLSGHLKAPLAVPNSVITAGPPLVPPTALASANSVPIVGPAQR